MSIFDEINDEYWEEEQRNKEQERKEIDLRKKMYEESIGLVSKFASNFSDMEKALLDYSSKQGYDVAINKEINKESAYISIIAKDETFFGKLLYRINPRNNKVVDVFIMQYDEDIEPHSNPTFSYENNMTNIESEPEWTTSFSPEIINFKDEISDHYKRLRRFLI